MRKASRKQRLEGKQKQWQIENPERVRELSKQHRNHDITDKEWNDCLKVFNYSCCYCGISEKEAKKRDKQNLHKDHVDDEGYNDLRNAAPACRSCNDRKWKHDMEEWFRQQEFFTEGKLEFINWWITEGYKDYIVDKPPYKVTRSRIYNEDNTYKMQHELWTVDEQRNMLERIKIASSKKEIEKELKDIMSNINKN